MDKIQKMLRAKTAEQKDKLTDEEVFSSQAFLNTILYLIKTMVKGEAIRLKFQRKPTLAPGYTDGSMLFASWDNSIVNFYHDRIARYFAILGIVFHEIGHILFLDFKEKRKCIDQIMRGNFPGKEPVPETDEQAEALVSVRKAMANPSYRKLFVEVLKDVENSATDPHDERKMIEKYGAFVEKSITFAVESLRSTLPPFEDLLKKKPVELALDTAFQYARFGAVFSIDSTTVEQNEIAQRVLSVKEHIDNARLTDSMKERYEELSYLLLAIWPIIEEQVSEKEKEEEPDPQQSESNDESDSEEENDSSGSTDESEEESDPDESESEGSDEEDESEEQDEEGGKVPDISDEQLEDLLQQAQNALENSGSTEAPVNRASGPEETQNANPGQSGNTEDVESGLDKIEEEIAKEKAEEQMDQTTKAELNREIKTANASSSHKSVPVRVIQHNANAVSPSDIRSYEETLAEIKPYSERIQRQIRNELKMEAEDIDKFLQYGREIDVNHAYRPDSRYFMNRKDPDSPPEMAISVLIDLSGSMIGEREQAARKAAILLDDFARGMKIPTSITGHTTSNRSVLYHVYSDFDFVSKSNRLSLADIEADWNGCNRDGAAIEIAASHLSKRPEEIRLLFILCDGQPNHPEYCYGGDEAKKDIQEIVKRYKKQGVETIACAIGGDKQQIQETFRDCYLDITDLAKLPRTLTGLVKKRIFQK